MRGSQEMPTMAPPPPAALLNHGAGQCCSSPTRRKIVITSVIKAGTAISFPTLTEEPDVPFISLLRHFSAQVPRVEIQVRESIYPSFCGAQVIDSLILIWFKS